MHKAVDMVSLNVGLPQSFAYQNKEVMSGIVKKPVAERVFLGTLHFEGDGQADLKHHGGKEKAVCVYPYEHYDFWEKELTLKLEHGAFGENLTTSGLVEEQVHIGDIYELGEAVVQVSQPRQPCFKLSMKYGIPELPVKVQETGYTGYYFRVLQEGYVGPGDRLVLRQKHPAEVSVSYANQIMHHDKHNIDGIKRILSVDALSESWRATFEKRLKGIHTDASERLNGK
ncbi:MOSC domain-containing protein [Paenibacillus turpanensis]|uniref:MOSC domain-containing protein n=1 Tax=Paenibacillus turpanensis TaxID=2689078 RepID=UPI00140E3054|nr:MOSC domain-containing protein [Paenibacillus turpanensis]